MFLSKLKFISGIKTYLVGGAIICTLLFAGYNYTVYLNNKIDALSADRDTLTSIVYRYEETSKQLTDTMNQNNSLLMGEIDSLNLSFGKYEGMLKANRVSVEQLSKLMKEIPDEKIQECLITELPADIVNRLFDQTKLNTQGTNSSK